MRGNDLWRAALLIWVCWGVALLLGGCGGIYFEEPADERPAIGQQNQRACV